MCYLYRVTLCYEHPLDIPFDTAYDNIKVFNMEDCYRLFSLHE